jgi:hypothetical protein
MSKNNDGLFDYTCPDTGRVLKLRKVPFTVTEAFYQTFKTSHPEPKPPMQTVDYGENEKIVEPNEAHPAYQRRLQEWQIQRNIWVNDQVRRFFAKAAIECEVDKGAVKTLRDQIRDAGGAELDPDDKFVYIWMICVGTLEGVNDLMTAIQRRSKPTEEAVATARDLFRSQVPKA